MHLSAKKQKDLTFLEVQAQQLVNEEIDEDNDYIGGLQAKDQARYEELLAKKKERKAVSTLFIGQGRDFLTLIGRDAVRLFGTPSQGADEGGFGTAVAEHLEGTSQQGRIQGGS
jgi:predicted CopG family antitoxin